MFWKYCRQKVPLPVALLWSGLLSMSLWYYAVLGMTKGNQVGMQPVCQRAKHWSFQCMQKTLKTSAKIRAGSLRSQGRSGGKKGEVNLALDMLHWSRPTFFPSLLCSRKSPSSFAESISFCLGLLELRDHCCRSLSHVCPLLGEAASQLPLPVLAKRLSCLPILLCVPFMVKPMPDEFWLCPHWHELGFTKSPLNVYV